MERVERLSWTVLYPVAATEVHHFPDASLALCTLLRAPDRLGELLDIKEKEINLAVMDSRRS